MRKSWWSEPTTWEQVCQRVRGRARWNAFRRRLARQRQQTVRQLWYRWSGKYGVGALIAAHVGASASTISRDLQALGLRAPRCPTCGRPRPLS